jgi:hypothetical protein
LLSADDDAEDDARFEYDREGLDKTASYVEM